MWRKLTFYLDTTGVDSSYRLRAWSLVSDISMFDGKALLYFGGGVKAKGDIVRIVVPPTISYYHGLFRIYFELVMSGVFRELPLSGLDDDYPLLVKSIYSSTGSLCGVYRVRVGGRSVRVVVAPFLDLFSSYALLKVVRMAQGKYKYKTRTFKIFKRYGIAYIDNGRPAIYRPFYEVALVEVKKRLEKIFPLVSRRLALLKIILGRASRDDVRVISDTDVKKDYVYSWGRKFSRIVSITLRLCLETGVCEEDRVRVLREYLELSRCLDEDIVVSIARLKYIARILAERYQWCLCGSHRACSDVRRIIAIYSCDRLIGGVFSVYGVWTGDASAVLDMARDLGVFKPVSCGSKTFFVRNGETSGREI